MKLDLGRYMIVTDDSQFIVKEKRVIQEGRMTKAENVGKETVKDMGYFSSLDFALKFLCKRACIDNDDIKDVVKEIKVLESKIEGFTRTLHLEG